MKLIVGLGNPGKKYENTRHNAGFMAIDKLSDDSFRHSKKFNADILKTTLEGEEVCLVKPQTFMNRSGEAVRAISSFFDVSLNDIWVIYDDMDLNLGTVRVRDKGSSGGHKGIESIISSLGNDTFPRFRIGVSNDVKSDIPTDKLVLQKFSKEEREILEESLEKTLGLVKRSLKDGIVNDSK